MELSKQLWEKYHSENSIINLSNYDLFCIRDYMEFSDLLTTNTNVLYVGVGTGSALEQLHELGCVVHSLDIAENARPKAELYSQFWLESDFENIPDEFFDIVIHHLVAQHLSNRQLERHFNNAIRCLKPTGILAMQYAYSLDGRELDVCDCQMTYSSTRNKATIKKMVSQNGGTISLHKDVEEYPEYKMGWRIIHAKPLRRTLVKML